MCYQSNLNTWRTETSNVAPLIHISTNTVAPNPWFTNKILVVTTFDVDTCYLVCRPRPSLDATDILSPPPDNQSCNQCNRCHSDPVENSVAIRWKIRSQCSGNPVENSVGHSLPIRWNIRWKIRWKIRCQSGGKIDATFGGHSAATWWQSGGKFGGNPVTIRRQTALLCNGTGSNCVNVQVRTFLNTVGR